MKRDTKVLIGLAAMAAAALAVYAAKKHYKRRVLNKVADEGYETAYDVLFPRKSTTGKKMHLGPILPG